MRLGATAQDASHIAAQAAVDLDLLFRQTGDPLDHLVAVVGPDGFWSTTTFRNQQFVAQQYSDNKNQTIGLVIGGLLAAGAVWYFWRS